MGCASSTPTEAGEFLNCGTRPKTGESPLMTDICYQRQVDGEGGNNRFDLDAKHEMPPPYLGSSEWVSLPLSPIRETVAIITTPLKSPGDSFDAVTLVTASSASSDWSANFPGGNEHIDSTELDAPFTPRRLFEEAPSFETELCDESSVVIRHGVVIKGNLNTPEMNERTTSPTGVCQTRVSTLPSMETGKPIRLRVTELYSSPSTVPSLMDYDNHFSFDPYFSTGQYAICTPNGSPFGNCLSIQMGSDCMTLQDRDGKMIAMTRSRHTYFPSHVVYSSKPRYSGQSPSAVKSECGPCFPWALVKKGGRTMMDEVTIHYLNPSSSSFETRPTFRSKHGFDGSYAHTHTVMTHNDISCCIIIRNPLNHDVCNVTIAPGIDPIVVLCYLAVHAKMDVEPKLSGDVSID